MLCECQSNKFASVGSVSKLCAGRGAGGGPRRHVVTRGALGSGFVSSRGSSCQALGSEGSMSIDAAVRTVGSFQSAEPERPPWPLWRAGLDVCVEALKKLITAHVLDFVARAQPADRTKRSKNKYLTLYLRYLITAGKRRTS